MSKVFKSLNEAPDYRVWYNFNTNKTNDSNVLKLLKST